MQYRVKHHLNPLILIIIIIIIIIIIYDRYFTYTAISNLSFESI